MRSIELDTSQTFQENLVFNNHITILAKNVRIVPAFRTIFEWGSGANISNNNEQSAVKAS